MRHSGTNPAHEVQYVFIPGTRSIISKVLLQYYGENRQPSIQI